MYSYCSPNRSIHRVRFKISAHTIPTQTEFPELSTYFNTMFNIQTLIIRKQIKFEQTKVTDDAPYLKRQGTLQ